MKKKEFTKKQRHEIYKLAKQYIETGIADYICQAIYYAIQALIKRSRVYNYTNALELCPEIQKLKPASIIDSEDDWWTCGTLGKNVRVWMLDTAIEQTKEIKPERVLNPIKTFNDVKIETYELAIEYLKKDKVPYSMCVALEGAIHYIFHPRRFSVGNIYDKYFAEEFKKNKPKDIPVDSFWFADDDIQTRIDYFNNIINELKNGTDKKEN